MLILSFYVHFFHHLEAYTIIFGAEIAYLISRTRFLPTKLIARKPEHHKTFTGVLLKQSLKLLVLRSVSAPAGCIDDQNALAPKLVKSKGLPF